MLFGTGFGPTNPRVSSALGMPPAPLANPVSVQIGGVDAPCAYAGLVGPGLNQVNIAIPQLPAGEYPIVASVSGVQTQTGATVVIGASE